MLKQIRDQSEKSIAFANLPPKTAIQLSIFNFLGGIAAGGAVFILLLYPVSIFNNVINSARTVDGLDILLSASGLIGAFLISTAVGYKCFYRSALYWNWSKKRHQPSNEN